MPSSMRWMTDREFLSHVESLDVCKQPVVAELVRRLAEACGSPVVPQPPHLDHGVIDTVAQRFVAAVRNTHTTV